MKYPHRLSLLSSAALATLASLGAAQAQTPPAETASPGQKVEITATREHRVSKGATNLPLEIKDTPQSISTLSQETLTDFAASASNDALRFGTGLTVDEWETNRTSFSSRGFDVMLTQIDGLGMTNDWGLVEGQLDTFVFERIELIRGANGLLTGVGNASGTINFVRKRPTNQDGGKVIATAGANDLKRVAVDYNKRLTADGAWAGRLVAAYEDKDAYLRDLHDRRGTVYGVVEGAIGDRGALTLGFTHQESRQRSPMWGSLTLPYADGSLAEFDTSASTSQDWTRWNLRSTSAFVEYTHALSSQWDAKITYNHSEGRNATRLLYAYSLTGTLAPDNTGLLGWPYRSEGSSRSDILDAHLAGRFTAFGRRHEATLGLSHSRQTSFSEFYDVASAPSSVLPAFPYDGDVYAEPVWGDKQVGADGQQSLTRFYGATRLALTDRLKAILGFNAVRLNRDGTSIYGGGVALDDETTRKFSPYLGATFDLTSETLAYASYSDIFQAQDQRDASGAFLAPMKGINGEIGVKSTWMDNRLLTTLALFTARQKGLATEAGFDPVLQQSYYEPKDVNSRGLEIEATGKVGKGTQLTAGFTVMRLTGPDGNSLYEWVPRRTVNLLLDSRLPMLPQMKVGLGARWQSDVRKTEGARQDAYLLADAFAAYDLTPAATVRVNVKNLTNEKYLRTVQFGAIYGAPRSASISLEYKL